ncbi:TIR domain-containing protein [Streptomyces sp. TLI_55]|nr:TIR domain-containing protein [Streptomyces sp. TLI_55]
MGFGLYACTGTNAWFRGDTMATIEASGNAPDGTSDQVWFISHAGADQAWAEWIAWQLLDAGLEVELDCWDWGAGPLITSRL